MQLLLPGWAGRLLQSCFSENMERNSTSFVLYFLGWRTNLWWNRSRGCSCRGLSEAWNRLSTLYNQHTDVYANKKTQKWGRMNLHDRHIFWLIESKSKVYAVYWMEPLASQLIKSSKRLLELVKLYICKTWEFRRTHGHWSASLVREDEDQIAITLLRRLTRLSWIASARLCIHNTPLLILISGKKFIWVVV